MSLSKANGKCLACTRDGVKARPHPSFSLGGDLGSLGRQLACLRCLERLNGEWPLKSGKKGKEQHQWCLVCGCETDEVEALIELLCVTDDERTILEQHRQLDEHGAALYLCDGADCPVAMCAVCLSRLFGTQAMLDADQGHWECPMCTGLEVASHPAVASALAPPAPVKKARLVEPTLAGGSGLSSSGSSSSSSSDSDEAEA